MYFSRLIIYIVPIGLAKAQALQLQPHQQSAQVCMKLPCAYQYHMERRSSQHALAKPLIPQIPSPAGGPCPVKSCLRTAEHFLSSLSVHAVICQLAR